MSSLYTRNECVDFDILGRQYFLNLLIPHGLILGLDLAGVGS